MLPQRKELVTLHRRKEIVLVIIIVSKCRRMAREDLKRSRKEVRMKVIHKDRWPFRWTIGSKSLNAY